MTADSKDFKHHIVLITATHFDDAASAYLEAHNCTVRTCGLAPGVPDTTLSTERLFELLTGADAWIVATARVTRDTLKKFPLLEVNSKRVADDDQEDLQEATQLCRV